MDKISNFTKRVLLEAFKKYFFEFKQSRVDIAYWKRVKLLEKNYRKSVFYANDGNEFIAKAIGQNLPLMVSRLGGTELDCIEFYIKNRVNFCRKYPETIKFRIQNNAGYFPVNDDDLDKFAEFFLESVKNVDVMGVLFNDYEAEICNNYCKHADLVELGCIEPYHWVNPWSRKLEGKKVLVVHPFVDSITKQYSEKRQFLFDDPKVLPEFDLKTVKAIQSSANATVDFPTWFDAYQYMCDEINKVDFDIAIIGAGAYGLPLASFVKNMGKQGINIGGFTQVLFGIKGRRFEIEYADTTAKLMNKYWVRPAQSETPEAYSNVENGCYW